MTQTSDVSETFTLSVNGVTIVLTATKTQMDGIVVPLTPTLQKLLFVVASRKGRMISKQELGTVVPVSGPTDNVNVHLCRLRKIFASVSESACGLIPSEEPMRCRIPAAYYVSPAPESHERYRFAFDGITIVMDDLSGKILVDGVDIGATVYEQKVFDALAEYAGCSCTKELLLEHLYGTKKQDWPDYKILDVYVCKLRQKLERAHPGADRFIATTWGRGHTLDPPTPTGMPPIDQNWAQAKWATLGNHSYPLSDLPGPRDRWVVRRKCAFIAHLNAGTITMTEVRSWYPDLSQHEIEWWRTEFGRNGSHALKATRLAA